MIITCLRYELTCQTRKNHRCEICGTLIVPGVTCVVKAFPSDDAVITTYSHPECLSYARKNFSSIDYEEGCELDEKPKARDDQPCVAYSLQRGFKVLGLPFNDYDLAWETIVHYSNENCYNVGACMVLDSSGKEVYASDTNTAYVHSRYSLDRLRWLVNNGVRVYRCGRNGLWRARLGNEAVCDADNPVRALSLVAASKGCDPWPVEEKQRLAELRATATFTAFNLSAK